MTMKYLEEVCGPEVLAAQSLAYGRSLAPPAGLPDDELSAVESRFIAERDSFYLATTSSSGWPYMQHRGGEKGFLKVVDSRRLVFADLSGNRQLVSTGNIAFDDRVSLFLMDYPGRRRLKILGRATILPRDDPEMKDLFAGEFPAGVERFVSIAIVAYDWNCPKFIKPRHDDESVAAYVAGLEKRIRELERALAATQGE